MSGICTWDTPDATAVDNSLRRVFRDRLSGVHVDDELAYFLVDTRYQMVTGNEIARIAAVLDIELDRIAFADSAPPGGSCRFVVNLSADTKPEYPAPMGKR